MLRIEHVDFVGTVPALPAALHEYSLPGGGGLDVSQLDQQMMLLAIDEAHRSPPVDSAYCVGCVVARGDTVLATGYSRELPGNTHAEQSALFKLDTMHVDFRKGKQGSQRTTLYTTMEPCSHRNSGATPCVTHCLRRFVERVVIGVLEPKNFVANCEGVDLLRNAGVEVVVLQGLEKECLAPNQHLDPDTGTSTTGKL